MSIKPTFQWLPVTRLPDGGELRLPLHTVKGERLGPTLGLSGALHGDEMIPSVNIIHRVLELLDPSELSGTVMAVPICNPLGAGRRSRLTPADGMNLNDAFLDLFQHGPTQEMKSITEQIASVLTDGFLSHLNYQIDYHTGGDNHTVHMIEYLNTPTGFGMARAFNMPILLRDSWGSSQMWGMAEKLGVECIVAEVGSAQLYTDWLERGVKGAFNVMRQLGMLPGTVEKPPRQYVIGNDDPNVHNLVILRPREAGLIIPEPGVDGRVHFDGQPVDGPRVLGRLLNIYDLSIREIFETPFKRTLLLASVAAPSWNYPGDMAYIFADADQAEVLD